MRFHALCPLFVYLSGGEKTLSCVKGGGTACRDGGIVKTKFYEKQSLSRLRRQLPLHKGAFLMFTYDVSIFLTSTASVSTETVLPICLLGIWF